jgi:two-component sensor histidine kinase
MYMINSLSLRQRILLLLSLASVPGLVVAVFLANSWLNDQTQQIGTSVERLAKLAAARNDTVIENARALLISVAQGYSGTDVNTASCRTYLTNWLKQFPAFTSLVLYNPQGQALCATTEGDMPQQAGDTAWFSEVRAERKFVLGRYMLGQTGNAILAAAYPVVDGGDGFQGAVALGIDLRWLDFLGKTIDLPENATITALNDSGELLAHNATVRLEKGAQPGPPPAQKAIRQMIALTSGTLRAEDASGSPRVYGVQKTRTGELVVTVGQAPYLEYTRYGEALLNTLAAPVLVLLLALLAAGYASEAFVTRYVRSLAQTAEAIEEGDLSARSEIPYSKYEIGRLAAAFDSMAAAIEQDQIELRNLAAERELLIRELNHRVKNNLQIVLSMLRPGVEKGLPAEEAQARLKSLAGRVQTLAQIHQLLYQRYDNAAPPLASYVQELTQLLGEFYNAMVGPAQVDAEADAVDLTIGQCISFGLILNELVANAQKHAFPEPRQNADISVRMTLEGRDGEDWVHLTVSDNGIGLPEDYALVDARSTGSRIVRALAHQLNGELWAERLQPGTAVHLRFPARTRRDRSKSGDLAHSAVT